MKTVGQGQVRIPGKLRERSGPSPAGDVESEAGKDSIALRKKSGKLKLAKWKGRCKKSFEELGYSSVDQFIEDLRGR
ncbi:MAG: hypothetical protein LAP13_13500 [Acidobacteriia bacterium]|nr:hypothetical protein [Terriglobia bacterium]